MKKVLLLSIYALLAGTYAQAQTALLSEDFNADCITTSSTVTNWNVFNPATIPSPNGQWLCAPGEGRNGTNGISCTNFNGGTSHADTSYFISPILNVSSYRKVYLHFDSKVTSVRSGGRFSVEAADSNFTSSGGLPIHDSDVTDSIAPLIGNGDLSDWVRHQVDLTRFKSTPFSVAFRYTGTTSSQETWFLDNINIDTSNSVGIREISKTELPLKVIGAATSDQVTISYTANAPGSYKLYLYDMMGREIHTEILETNMGTYTYKISNLSLRPGMYLIKMGNETGYGTVKVIVP